uniref:Uncharacterized protein n=1 Tax=Ditylenchus dipsaci TaxID=166011 RepID=A0A915EHA7_9BILA
MADYTLRSYSKVFMHLFGKKLADPRKMVQKCKTNMCIQIRGLQSKINRMVEEEEKAMRQIKVTRKGNQIAHYGHSNEIYNHKHGSSISNDEGTNQSA